MTHTTLKTAAFSFYLVAAVVIALVAPDTANAGGRGKEYFSETYTFSKPMNGYEGRAGDYYCSYIKTPVTKCDAGGNNCKVVAWNLEQHCQ